MELKKLPPSDPRVSLPLYTINEAAGYLNVPNSTLQSWTKGEPLVSTLRRKGHQPSLSFIGFAEAFLVAAARKRGFSAKELREGIQAIRRDWGIEHALANRLIYMDNKLYLGVQHPHTDQYERARDRQLQMIEAVKDEIEFVEFGRDYYPDRIQLPTFETEVVVSPFVAAGQPIVRRSGVRVRDVAKRYALKKESVEYIADDFGLSVNEVLDLAHAPREGAIA